MNNNKIINLAEPTSGSDAARLSDVLAVSPGTGVNAFLVTPSSANLAAALTDETGTGLAVFNTSPSLVTPTITGGSFTGGTDIAVADGGTGASTAAAGLANLGGVSLTNLALSTGAALVGSIASGTGAVARTAQAKMRDFVSVKDFGAVGDGTTNDSSAFALAVASVATSAVICVPDSAGYLLNTRIDTGTKKIVWLVGATTITGPAGDFALSLDSNGSQLLCAGRGSTIFKLRAPASAMVMPTVTTARTAGALTTASPSGGSGFVTTPVAIVANSPAADAVANDAAVVATVSGGTVSALAIVAAGADYVADPAVTFVGGGHGAVKINGVMGCVVRDFSIDFNSVANSVGVYHYGGWFADISNIDRVFTVATGVSSESSTSIGLVVDSHTDGVPGPTGSYGGAYVCHYSNLFFNKRALIGHDTSTGTTLQFTTCDFKNSYIHGCVGITEINPVNQAIVNTDNYHLVNVDGLTLIGGDIEDAGTIFHTHGSCNNFCALKTLTGSATGPERRGPIGTGWFLDWADTANPLAPMRTGSAGAAGHRFQNTGWTIQHGHGVDWSGDTFTIGATNIKPISATQAELYDNSASGLYLWSSTGGETGGRMAYAAADPVTTFDLYKFDAAGLSILSGGKVLGTRKTGWSVDTGTAKRTANATYSGTAEATYTQATIQTLMDMVRDLSQTVKALKDDLHATAGHGLIGT